MVCGPHQYVLRQMSLGATLSPGFQYNTQSMGAYQPLTQPQFQYNLQKQDNGVLQYETNEQSIYQTQDRKQTQGYQAQSTYATLPQQSQFDTPRRTLDSTIAEHVPLIRKETPQVIVESVPQQSYTPVGVTYTPTPSTHEKEVIPQKTSSQQSLAAHVRAELSDTKQELANKKRQDLLDKIEAERTATPAVQLLYN